MADLKQGMEYEISVKDATTPGVESATKKVKDAAKKAADTTAESTDKIVKSVGQLPGVLGKVQNALGGIGGKAMAVIGAFKAGWDIGTWLTEKVIEPLLGVKDPIEELKRQNREMRREWELAFKAYETSLKEWGEHWSNEARKIENARQCVEDLTQAYLKMHAARERIVSAQDDADVIAMQRDKFSAMAGASTPEEAAALGKYHDILIAEAKAKQEMAKFDREAEASRKRLLSTEKQLDAAVDRRIDLFSQLDELNRKIQYAESDKAVEDLGLEGAVKMEEQLKETRSSLEKEIDAAERAEEQLRDELAAAKEASGAEGQERANIAERARLEIDEKKKAYDDYVAQVEADDARLAAEEWNRRQEEMRLEAEMELESRKKVEQQLAAQRMAGLRKEIQERAAAEAAAQQRLAAAKQAVDRAWGWYRDRDSLAAQLQEEKADAAARQQYERDFDRLRRQRPDWENAKNLSLDQEAVRRVALARREETAAARDAAETAANTRRAADALEVIEAAFQEGGE